MKTLVLGEFKEISEMEKMVWSSPLDYLILGDLESLEKEEEILLSFDCLLLYLKRYETFQKYYPFIRRYKEQIVLWIRGKQMRKFEEFFRNSGYTTVRSLSDLEDKITPPRNDRPLQGNVLGVCSGFGVAMELAYHQGHRQQVLVVDLEKKRPPSGYRLGIDPSKPRRYLSETYDFETLYALNRFGNFHVIGYAGHQKRDLVDLEEFLTKAREDFDLLILNNPVQLNQELMDQILYVGALDHESIEDFLRKGLPLKKTVFMAVYDKKRVGDFWYLKKQLGKYDFKMVRRSEIYNYRQPFERINLDAVALKSVLPGVLKGMTR